MTSPKPPADAVRCSHAGCPTKPTRRVERRAGEPPWFGCAQHAPAMDREFGCGGDR